MQRERCHRAIEAQHFNAEQRQQAAQLQLEQERLELERQRLELERRRVEVEEARARAESPDRGAPMGAEGASVPGPLLVFGGPGHKTFLGCLCDETDERSVFKQHGKYGHDGLNVENSSLWSTFGMFRDRFGDYSACASFAKDPPVVVTSGGVVVCRLSIDSTNPYQCRDPKLVDWLTHGPCGE